MRISTISIVALVQTFSVVVGVVFAGFGIKLNTLGGQPAPAFPAWMRDHGAILLLFPVLWVAAATSLRTRLRENNFGRLVIAAGVISVVLLLSMAFFAFVVCFQRL